MSSEFEGFDPRKFVENSIREEQARQQQQPIGERLMGKPTPKMKELPKQNTLPSTQTSRLSQVRSSFSKGLSRFGNTRLSNRKVLRKNNVILTLQSHQPESLLSSNSVFFKHSSEMLQDEKNKFIRDGSLFFSR